MNPYLTVLLIVSIILSSIGPSNINPTTPLKISSPSLSQRNVAENNPTPTADWPYPPPLGETVTPTPGATTTATIAPLPTIGLETSTPTVTPEPSSNPIVTPSATVVPESIIEVSFSPRFITKNQAITLSWHFKGNSSFSARDGYQIVIQLPEGLSPVSQADGVYDPQTRTLSISTDKQSSHIKLETLTGFSGPYPIQVSLYQNTNLVATTHTEVEQAESTAIMKQGGEAKGFNGKVNVRFLEGSLDEDIIVYIKSVNPHKKLPYLLLGEPFEIIAMSMDGTREIHHFSTPIQIRAQYDSSSLLKNEQDLKLAYFDEAQQAWAYFASTVDSESHQVIATSNHLTIASLDISSWQAAQLPSVASFQTSQFTGAATYSYPFWMPPGPGGLQPSLTLSYNSQVVDSGSLLSQASWVGMGWSLDTGYIERNMRGTYNDAHADQDDTFTLTVGGISSLLLKTGSIGNEEYYETAEESFWKVTRNTQSNMWTAKDKTGTTYTFGGNNAYTHSQANFPYLYVHYATPTDLRNFCDAVDVTWRWSLSEVKNIFGKSITYTYDRQNYNTPFTECPFGPEPASADLAVLPKTIEYPNQCYSVVFNTVADRTDYYYPWQNNRTFFTKSRLTNIQIKQDPSCGGNYNRVIRQWNFGYASQASDHIFPNYIWPGWPTGSSGGRTLTLTSIQEFGVDSAASYPATTFKYDGMHLQEANNGQGGRIQFKYEGWYEPLSGKETNVCDSDDSSLFCQANRWMEPGGTWTTAGWHTDQGTYGGYNDQIPGGKLAFRDEPHTTNWQWVHPGMAIRLHVNIPGTSFQTGFRYYNPSLASPIDILCPNTYNVADPNYASTRDQTAECNNGLNPGNFVFFLPFNSAATASTGPKVGDLLKCGTSCNINRYDRIMLPTRYRVSQKLLFDDVTDSVHPKETYTYRYDGAAMNDTTVSSAANTLHPYFQPFTEFRGNAMVQQEGPDGRVDTSFYYQDDALKGHPSVTLTHTQRIYDAFTDSTFAGWTASGTKSIERFQGDPALKLIGLTNDWSVNLTRSAVADQVRDGEGVLIQFRTEGAAQAVVQIRSASQWWGIHAASDDLYQMSFVNGQEVRTPLHMNQYASGKWYVALLVRDDNGQFLSYVWERDNPANYALFQADMPNNQTWSFYAWAYNGTIWLDSFMQGKFYNLTRSLYQSGTEAGVWTSPTVTTPQKFYNSYLYTGLAVVWPRLTEEAIYQFEGSGSPIGRKTVYAYNQSLQANNQFGNVTQVTEYRFNGTQWNGTQWVEQWIAYRKQETNFYPNAGSNLVGLPARQTTYACSNQAQTCDSPTETSEIQFWYDSNGAYSNPPTAGVLSVKRTFLKADQTSRYYTDEVYGYDSWGNQTSVTRYSKPGVSGSLATGGSQTTTTCYGVQDQPAGCTTDPYFTFPLWQINALGHMTRWTYEPVYAAPITETDPNNSVTTAGYDNLGRMISLVRPGDDGISPTVTIDYAPSGAKPFWTAAHQKIDGTHALTVRKYYDGLGQLIQTQIANADLAGFAAQSRDVVVDYFYASIFDKYDNAYHKEVRQSVAYSVPASTGYHSPDTSQPVTRTIFDVLGRNSRIYATDAPYDPSHPETSAQPTQLFRYGIEGLQQLTVLTTRKDGRQVETKSYTDEWNRVKQVVSPKANDGTTINPSVVYEYDTLNRLKQTTYGSAVTTIQYDASGRKLDLLDPDMGHWYYGYDAIGNLTQQIDARKYPDPSFPNDRTKDTQKAICLYYDSLNRLKGKTFETVPADKLPSKNPTVPWQCANDPGYGFYAVSNYYDEGGAAAYAIGRRTRMTDRADAADLTWNYEVTWNYDLRGRVSSEYRIVADNGNWLGAYTTSWGYFSNDQLAWMGYPNGEVVNYGYNNQGSIISVASQATTYVNAIQYDAAGRLVKRALGWTSGSTPQPILETNYTYFDWTKPQGQGRLRSFQTIRLADMHPIQDLHYETVDSGNPNVITPGYDEVGNIRRIEEWRCATGSGTCANALYQTQTYTYDNLNRLLTANVAGQGDGLYSETDQYDPATGNLLYKGSTFYEYKGSQPHAVTHLNRNTNPSYSYNENGGMISRVWNGGMVTLNYDEENHLSSVTDGTVTGSYRYDGDGKRIYSKTGNDITIYVGDYFEVTQSSAIPLPDPVVGSANPCPVGKYCLYLPLVMNNPIWEPPAHQEWRSYFYTGTTRVAMRTQGGKRPVLGVMNYLLSDHLGSTSVITDATGNVTAEQRYTAWGQDRPSGSNVSQTTTFGYTGQRRADFGIYFYGARWYDSSMNQWLQPDSVIPEAGNPLDYNRYSYNRNNPLRYSDPSGHFPWIPFLIGVAAVGVIGVYVANDVLSVAPATDNRAPAPTSYDMTGWLTDRLNENKNAPVTHALNENFTSGDPVKIAGATKAWVALVRTTGTWDYKTDIINAKVKDDNDNIKLCGDTLNFQAIANIHYGYIGRASGIPQSVLEMGAGAFQIKDNWGSPGAIGTPETYFDQYFDNWMVKFGGWLYEQYGEKFDSLTYKQLEEAYKQYKKEHGDPGKP